MWSANATLLIPACGGSGSPSRCLYGRYSLSLSNRASLSSCRDSPSSSTLFSPIPGPRFRSSTVILSFVSSLIDGVPKCADGVRIISLTPFELDASCSHGIPPFPLCSPAVYRRSFGVLPIYLPERSFVGVVAIIFVN